MRSGDSPLDGQGRFFWLHEEPADSSWLLLQSAPHFYVDTCDSVAWLCVRLPQKLQHGSALMVSCIKYEMQVYLDCAQIYQAGHFEDKRKARFIGWKRHLIPLPDDFGGKFLYFRLWSVAEEAGFDAPVLLGPMEELVKSGLRNSLGLMVLAVLFFVSGMIAWVVFLGFCKTRRFMGLALFFTSLGLFTGSNTPFIQMIYDAPALLFALDFYGLLTAPLGGLLLIEQLIRKRHRPYIRRIRQAHLVFLFASVFAVYGFGKPGINVLYSLFFTLVSISILMSVVFIVKSRTRRRFQVQLVMGGLALALVFFAVEILIYLYVGKGLIYEMSLLPLGVMLFLALLIWSALYRYFDSIQQKEVARRQALKTLQQSERLKSRIADLMVQRRQLKDAFRLEAVLESGVLPRQLEDQTFLVRAVGLIEDNLNNPELDIAWLCHNLGFSRSQLHRKLQALAGQSASEFIRSVRLERAALILKESECTVTEVAFRVGFNHVNYFHKCFRARFGVTPSSYARPDAS